MPGETVGICCPSRYTYNFGPLGCSSYLSHPTSAFLFNFSYEVYYEGWDSVISTELSTSNPGITTTLAFGVATIYGISSTTEYAIRTYTETRTLILTSESTISMTAGVGPGTVYASAIQVRWKSSDDLYSHPLSSGAMAGIGVGVVLISFVIIGIIAWVIRRRHSRRHQSSTPERIPHGEPSTFFEKPELQASKLTETISPSATKLEHSSGADFPELGTNIAATSFQDTSSGAAEVEDHSRRNLGLGHVSHLNQTTPFELAENASITSDSAIKRKPVVQTNQPVSQSTTSDLGLTPHPRPTSNPDSASLSRTTLGDSSLPPGNLLAGDAERASSIGLSPTPGDTQPSFLGSNSVAATVDEEMAWLEAEQDRIRERKERLREMQELKREEERLAREEDELRKRMRAVKHGVRGVTDNEVVWRCN
jgi:hypothetical protein